MEIYKSADRTISLDHYTVERCAVGYPVIVKARLIVSVPQMKPAEVRVDVEYEADDLPHHPSEQDFGRRLMHLIGNRFS